VDLVLPNDLPYCAALMPRCGEFEAMGFDGLWFTDHIVGYEKHKPVHDMHWLEATSVLAYAVALTNNIRLGVGVLVLPYRDAVLTAKMLSTLDVLSGGRIDLGVGTGWALPEFYALGRERLYARRGAYTDEALEVMLACWSAENGLEFDGEFQRFRNARMSPRPVQQPRIPLWIGARGIAARAPLRRAAKYADYWHPTGLSPAELRASGEHLSTVAGREIPTSIRARIDSTASLAEMQDWLGGYNEVGCAEAAIDVRSPDSTTFMRDAGRLANALKSLRK